MDHDDLLPTKIEEEIDLDHIQHPEVPDLPANVAHTTVKANNLEIATMNLKVVREMWNHATSFGRVMRLLKESRDAVRFRNDTLGIPNGFVNTGTQRSTFEPLD